MSDARPHAPSAHHLRAGLRAGLFPRTEVLGAAAAACALLVALVSEGARGAAYLRAFTLRALSGELPRAADVRPALWLALLPTCAAALFALALRRVLVGGGEAGQLRVARKPASSHSGRALAAFGVLAITLAAVALCLRSEPYGLAELARVHGVRVSAWLLVCALIEALFARAAFVRTMHLSRRELVAEQRETHGHEGVREARERARREGAR